MVLNGHASEIKSTLMYPRVQNLHQLVSYFTLMTYCNLLAIPFNALRMTVNSTSVRHLIDLYQCQNWMLTDKIKLRHSAKILKPSLAVYLKTRQWLSSFSLVGLDISNDLIWSNLEPRNECWKIAYWDFYSEHPSTFRLLIYWYYKNSRYGQDGNFAHLFGV